MKWQLAFVVLGLAGCPREKNAFDLELERHRDELEAARPIAGELWLDCPEKDAEVYIDGVLQGQCSDFEAHNGQRLSAGPHRIEVKKAGFIPYVARVDASDARTQLHVNLAPMH